MRRVAIVGAGIGGLTTAIGLQHAGWDVTVFERSGANTQAGAGLSLFGNAWRALDSLGVGDAVREIAGREQHTRAGQRRRDGRWLAVTPPHALRELRVVHRADLHRAFTAELRPGTVTYGKGIDRTPEGFDLVVAADGLRSRTRASWPGDPGLRYSGYTSWRAVTTRPVDLRDEAGESLGRGERVGLAPLPDGRVYWFGVASMPAGTRFDDEYAEVRRRFDGWHSPVAEVLDAIDPAALVRTDIFDLARPLATFARGTTVLLGDAAHAMTPDLGQGAAMAIEDAATLTHLLGSSPVDEALRAYDVVRRRRTQAVARRARAMGRLLQSRGPLRDLVLRLTPPAAVARQLAALQAWRAPGDRSDLAELQLPGSGIEKPEAGRPV
ncbi:monooxygenase [Paractinoplanes abujensis]|uniref:2-polyprenyl-6-methoxyphenol hydroxylase-like FAD-dependent oxidoreductase n=1 Tax=Paractinoplanes abujensis TaxID=882441 RepID=A0A7W7G199_9ACTN|nr:FAD-dependent oxidoreductase [Actinoplanes abujensis]MBB4693953.1 2-polyprenyl-6-methoxyphenol hydroxylase-like FAD-dependent oxidoreductase [Actinoplanes abujensis]GID21392.1 monooxygenase [Actinoplanes abujensis]